MNDLIVIGGSAGALEALLALLPALSAELVTPIAIALHLGPNQRNLVPDLLRRVTQRTVVEAEDKQQLEPRFVYIAPPNYHVLVERTRSLALSVDDLVNFSRPSIDVLFESAADAYRTSCTGVLLSGANEDGARGLQRIADAGGRAYVQAPATASHPTMPDAGLRRVGSRARVFPISELAGALAPSAMMVCTEGRP
ncbi:MAG TPA: chemotaxis protein CheB [Kofleriaceae bacterium]|nr:chemotaxis protein CheB [Kofleriaceae bacterium]